MNWNVLIELINTLAWPIVVAIALIILRKPLATFLDGLSGRVTRFSAFDVSIELATLETPKLPWSDPTIIKHSELIRGHVNNSDVMSLFEGIQAETAWDYLIVDIKGGSFWLASRVFIFSVFLQSMRGLKCVVFIETKGESRQRLIGLASPQSVRDALSQAFPWMEKSMGNSLVNSAPFVLTQPLKIPEAGKIIEAFLQDPDMRLDCHPKVVINNQSKCHQSTQDKMPTEEIKPEEWVELERKSKNEKFWEHTKWLDIYLINKDLRKVFYNGTLRILRIDSKFQTRNI